MEEDYRERNYDDGYSGAGYGDGVRPDGYPGAGHRGGIRPDGYEREKKSYRRGFASGILAAVFIVLATILVYTVLHLKVDVGETETAIGSSAVDRKLETLKALIDKYYLDDADDEALVESVYAGLLNGLGDPYSVYYTEEEYSAMLESATGRYAGIGALMSQNIETGEITITRPFDGSPAQEAGLIAGDVLVAVEGEPIGDEELSSVVARIKGEIGTTVNLTVLRGRETLDFTIERADIEVQTVTSRMLDGQVGYIYVVEFDEVTTDQFHEALTELKAQGMESLIIDLRDNPGGNLDVVTQMLDEILPEGLLVYTEDKYGNRSEISSDADCLELPLVVLVNENSASASEIFAGAVKDYGWGTLVGTTTYGKGIVQRLFDLGDGTAIKLTISKYYTPSGNNIHGIGIEPDVEVELPDEVYEDGIVTEEEDTQLGKALEILTGNGLEGQE